MRFVDRARERVKDFGDELRRSWMLRASVALLVLGGFGLYLFNIGIGGMMILIGFFLYWQDKDRRMAVYYRSLACLLRPISRWPNSGT